MSSYNVEEIDNKSRRKTLEDRWAEYLQHVDNIVNNTEQDPFESDVILRVAAVAHHAFSSLNKESKNILKDIIANHNIKNLQATHNPSAKEYSAVTIQLASAVAAAVLNITPLAIGASQNATAIAKGLGDGISAVGGTGSQTIQGVFQSSKQASLTEENYGLELSKSQQEEILASIRASQDSYHRHKEEAARMNQMKFEASRSVNS